MKNYYKILLVIFAVFTAFNLYAIDWKLGIWHEENAKFLLSLAAGVAGILLIFVLNSWSKLAPKR